MTFQDHFSDKSAAYALFRPRYPGEMFRHLAKLAPGRAIAWDCATGSGQAAIALAEHFRAVIATDASSAQIASAIAHERVEYRVASAERSGLDDGLIDLVTVAQALHWFDLNAFWREVDRVLVVRGVVAVWSYSLLTIDPSLDEIIDRFYRETVGPYWPPERALVERGYGELEFPFEEITISPTSMEQSMTLDELAGYVTTWSATNRFIRERGEDPVPQLVEELRDRWGDESSRRSVRWPLSFRVGRKAG